MRHDVTTDIQGKDVLVIEDIVDSRPYGVLCGRASQSRRGILCPLVRAGRQAVAPRDMSVRIDYLGFTVPDRFVVGYGLDFDNKFRYLPDIYALENHDSQ